MGLDRLDGGIDDLPPALGPARSWIELEERRRVFWGAFAIDCHASISTGWPYLINAEDVAFLFLSNIVEPELMSGADYDPASGIRGRLYFWKR